MIKTRPQKPKTTSQLIKELDEVFSLYIRLNYADNQGMVRCFVTGERIHYKMADAAHFHPRQHMGTRWHEQNVHPATQVTNRYHSDHLDQYATQMHSRYCSSVIAELDQLRLSTMKFTAFEL